MKKSLVLIAMMLLSAAAFSQMGFGIKAGYNYATIKTDSAAFYDIKGKSSFHMGIFLVFPVKDKFSVQTDIMFSGGGGTTREIGEARLENGFTVGVHGYHKNAYTINYISIPIVGRYSFGPANVQLGPQIGILGRALVDDSFDETKTTYDTASESYKNEHVFGFEKLKDVQDYFKKIDFGLTAGLGCEFGRFNGSVRYYLGLMNISNYGDAIKNTSIQVSVGWRLSEEY